MSSSSLYFLVAITTFVIYVSLHRRLIHMHHYLKWTCHKYNWTLLMWVRKTKNCSINGLGLWSVNINWKTKSLNLNQIQIFIPFINYIWTVFTILFLLFTKFIAYKKHYHEANLICLWTMLGYYSARCVIIAFWTFVPCPWEVTEMWKHPWANVKPSFMGANVKQSLLGESGKTHTYVCHCISLLSLHMVYICRIWYVIRELVVINLLSSFP